MRLRGTALRRALLAALTVATAAGAPGALAAAAPADGRTAGPERHADPRDAAPSPLDLAEVSLGQQDVRMVLRLRTVARWDAGALERAEGRALCVVLHEGGRQGATARICVTRRAGTSALSLSAFAADGTTRPARALAAEVRRPSPTSLTATFLPAAAGLRSGRYAWQARSDWTDRAACVAGCADRVPDDGAFAGRVTLVGGPPCFGAADRDSAHPCDNPRLRNAVTPPASRTQPIAPNPYCDAREHRGLLSVCGFGAPAGEAARTFAVVGDSHASALKPALEVLTHGRGWRGLSVFRSGCPATAATPVVPSPARARQCVRWNSELRGWLAAHDEVSTVFLSSHAHARVVAGPGQSPFAAARAGYRAEIGALLRRRPGRRVVVIRDVPTTTEANLRCVAAAVAGGRRRPGRACARPRGDALRPDALAAAAAGMRSARVQVIDLTRHFCDAARCFPVIGGALVLQDTTHLTAAFSATLGPFVLRALPR